VADDGPGVAVEAREQVFEPGVRAAGLNGHRGAGLGLPLARRLARAAGGDITLDDTPGALGGARFVVTLPKG
jgi:signal transduction histidine kinase